MTYFSVWIFQNYTVMIMLMKPNRCLHNVSKEWYIPIWRKISKCLRSVWTSLKDNYVFIIIIITSIDSDRKYKLTHYTNLTENVYKCNYIKFIYFPMFAQDWLYILSKSVSIRQPFPVCSSADNGPMSLVCALLVWLQSTESKILRVSMAAR